MATIVVVLEIDFANLILAVIHERAFMTSTIYTFLCSIFKLSTGVRLPIWHCDRLHQPAGIINIGLIRDEANVAGPHRGPRIEVPPLSENLARWS